MRFNLLQLILFTVAFFAATTAAPIMAAAQSASKAPGWYASVAGEFFSPTGDFGDAYDSAAGFAATVGYDFGNVFSIEGEVGFTETDHNRVDVDARLIPIMINGRAKFPFAETGFSGYFGAGLGVTEWKSDIIFVNGTRGSESGSDFSYQVMAGLSYRWTPNVSTRLGYRLFNVDTDGAIDTLRANIGELALVYHF